MIVTPPMLNPTDMGLDETTLIPKDIDMLISTSVEGSVHSKMGVEKRIYTGLDETQIVRLRYEFMVCANPDGGYFVYNFSRSWERPLPPGWREQW